MNMDWIHSVDAAISERFHNADQLKTALIYGLMCPRVDASVLLELCQDNNASDDLSRSYYHQLSYVCEQLCMQMFGFSTAIISSSSSGPSTTEDSTAAGFLVRSRQAALDSAALLLDSTTTRTGSRQQHQQQQLSMDKSELDASATRFRSHSQSMFNNGHSKGNSKASFSQKVQPRSPVISNNTSTSLPRRRQSDATGSMSIMKRCADIVVVEAVDTNSSQRMFEHINKIVNDGCFMLDGTTYNLPPHFFVIYICSNTDQIPKSILKNIFHSISVDGSISSLPKLLSTTFLKKQQALISYEQIEAARISVLNIVCSPEIHFYIREVVSAVRKHKRIATGVSLTANKDIIMACQICAVLSDNLCVNPKHLGMVLGKILRHRVVFSNADHVWAFNDDDDDQDKSMGAFLRDILQNTCKHL